MKNLLLAMVILGVILLTGCEKENPVSAAPEISDNSLQKTIIIIPNLFMESFYGSFQSSGSFSNHLHISILEIIGNGTVTGIGNSKIFSFTRINSTTQTGSLDITTAKGDRITGTLSGTVKTGAGNILYFSGTYKLIHGTGSLSGVTGAGNYSGSFDKTASTGKLILDGTIHWPEVIKVDRNAAKN
jgi:hypothetical protein